MLRGVYPQEHMHSLHSGLIAPEFLLTAPEAFSSDSRYKEPNHHVRARHHTLKERASPHTSSNPQNHPYA